MKVALFSFLAGCIIAWFAYGAMHGGETPPDTTQELRDTLEQVRGENAAIEAQRVADLRAYEDSVAAWTARDADLRAREQGARAETQRVAQELRMALDTTGVRLLDELEAGYEDRLAAKDVRIDVLETRLTSAEKGWSDERFANAGLRDELVLAQRLQAATDGDNDALRTALSARNKQNRLLKIGGGIILGKAAYDLLLGGNG